MEQDTEDSRTSVVGRKRHLQDRDLLAMMDSEQSLGSSVLPAVVANSARKADAALISPTEVSVQADGNGYAGSTGIETPLESVSTVVQQKDYGVDTTMAMADSHVPSQTKPAVPSDQVPTRAGIQAQNTVPVFVQDSPRSSTPKDDSTPSSSGWNKGVQPGFRTSFGSKRSSRTTNPPKQSQISQLKGPVIGETTSSSSKSHSVETQKPIRSHEPQSSKAVLNNPSPVEATTAETLQISQEPPESIRAGTRSTNVGAVTADVDLVLAQTKSWPLPAAWRAAVLINTGKTFYPAPARVTRPFQHHGKVFATPLIFNELGMPYKIQDFSFNIFGPAFLKANLDGMIDSNWKIGDLRSAFHTFQSNWYSHLPGLQPILLASSRATGFLTFEQAMDLASEGRKPAPQPSVEPQLHALKSSRRLSKQTERVQSLIPPTSVTIDLTDGSPKHFNAIISKDNDVRMTNSLPLSKPKVAAIVSSAEERALQKRYFPSDGESIFRCLACGDAGHSAGTCPALSCEHCVQAGKHSTFMCPSHQRCLKCRQRGHGAANCPEKLFARADDFGPCDICSSSEHLEEACHFVWRSFAPKQEEIRVVRDIPIHCYQCGADGHYGPSCGLSGIQTGGYTWTLANLRKYVDSQSLNRAVSAGVDYSIPKPKQKEFSIKGKGKSNDPFTIEDSEDDESDFIRPKINKAPPQNGHIHFNEPPKNLPRSFNDNSYRPQYRGYQEDYRDSGMRFNVQNPMQESYPRAAYPQHLTTNYPPLDLTPREERYSMRKRPRANSPGPAPEVPKRQKKKKNKAQAKAQANAGGPQNSAPTDPKIQRKLGKKAKKREREAKAAAAAASRNAGQY